MKKNYLILALIFIFLVGCSAAMGSFPYGSGTQVDLSRKNYRVLKANAVGEDTGFSLLGVVPFVSPKYVDAMTDLYSNAGVEEGKAHALANVVQERSTIYLILFSLPKLSVRADIIEFVE
jgi:hypothetical protein